MLGSKIVQVKVIMPPKDGIMRRTPTGRAVGRNLACITSSSVQEFVTLLPISATFTILQKWEMSYSLQQPQNISHYVFLFRYYKGFSSPLIPPVACHCNMDVWRSSREMLHNCYMRNYYTYFCCTLHSLIAFSFFYHLNETPIHIIYSLCHFFNDFILLLVYTHIFSI